MHTWANPSLQGWIWKCYKGMFCKYNSTILIFLYIQFQFIWFSEHWKLFRMYLRYPEFYWWLSALHLWHYQWFAYSWNTLWSGEIVKQTDDMELLRIYIVFYNYLVCFLAIDNIPELYLCFWPLRHVLRVLVLNIE